MSDAESRWGAANHRLVVGLGMGLEETEEEAAERWWAAAAELAHQEDVLVRWLLRLAWETWAEETWEHVPEVGQHDIEAILELVESKYLPGDVTLEDNEKAMAYFEARASKED